jgi:hypothetical protein
MEEGEDRMLAWVESPAFDTTAAEFDEFRLRLRSLIQEFRERAKSEANVSGPRKRLNFTYALRERPVVPAEPARQHVAAV